MKLTTNDLTQALLADPLQRVSAEILTPGFWQQVQENHKSKYGCPLPLSEILKAIELLIKRDDLYDLDLLLLDVVPKFEIFNERTCNTQALAPRKHNHTVQPSSTYRVENYEPAHAWFLGLPPSDQEHIRSQILNRLYQIQSIAWGDDPFAWHLGQACLVDRWQRAVNTAYGTFCNEYDRRLHEYGYIKKD